MTITATTNRIQYTGDGSSTGFAFPFRIFAATDLEVFLAGVLQTTGYSVTGGSPSGTVNFAAAPGAGVAVLIRRAVPATPCNPSHSAREAGRERAFSRTVGAHPHTTATAARAASSVPTSRAASIRSRTPSGVSGDSTSSRNAVPASSARCAATSMVTRCSSIARCFPCYAPPTRPLVPSRSSAGMSRPRAT